MQNRVRAFLGLAMTIGLGAHLSGCSQSDSVGNSLETKNSSWTLDESKDKFTDEVTRSYSAEIQSGNGTLELACSEKKNINLYYSYSPGETNLSFINTAKIRVDSETPKEIPWTVFGSNGQSWPEDSNFIKSLFGKDKLAIEIFAAGSALFSISGIEDAYKGLIQVGCKDDTVKSQEATANSSEEHVSANGANSPVDSQIDAVAAAADEAEAAAAAAAAAAEID